MELKRGMLVKVTGDGEATKKHSCKFASEMDQCFGEYGVYEGEAVGDSYEGWAPRLWFPKVREWWWWAVPDLKIAQGRVPEGEEWDNYLSYVIPSDKPRKSVKHVRRLLSEWACNIYQSAIRSCPVDDEVLFKEEEFEIGRICAIRRGREDWYLRKLVDLGIINKVLDFSELDAYPLAEITSIEAPVAVVHTRYSTTP